MKMQKVKANQAAEWLFNLLRDNPWLRDGKIGVQDSPKIRQEAIAFLVSFAKHGANDWQDTNQDVRGMVTEILTYLLQHLAHPQSNFYHQTWKVEQSLTNEQKILQIIAHEIEHNSNHSSATH
jgi:hypothetical protein